MPKMSALENRESKGRLRRSGYKELVGEIPVRKNVPE